MAYDSLPRQVMSTWSVAMWNQNTLHFMNLKILSPLLILNNIGQLTELSDCCQFFKTNIGSPKNAFNTNFNNILLHIFFWLKSGTILKEVNHLKVSLTAFIYT